MLTFYHNTFNFVTTLLFKVSGVFLSQDMDDKWAKLPSDGVIDTTIQALSQNGINALVVDTAEEAKKKVLELIPEGSEVFTTTSKTLDEAGISEAINESGRYKSVRQELMFLDREKDALKMQKLGAVPEYVVGSVHALTEDGKVLVASASGSQLPAYVYGASKVIWVVSADKITKDLDSALKRIYDYVLPLESERAHKAYGVPGSFVSKLLIFNKESNPKRIILIFVKEKLGF